MLVLGPRAGFSLGAATLGKGAWTPLALGSKLLAWWDASSGITLSGNQVTAWADRKNGYSAVQGLSSARPSWSATSFGGKPGLTFDGNDDELTLASQPFPTTAGSEVHAVIQQGALPGDANVRSFFSYGGGGANTARRAYRISGNTGQIQVGSGSSNVTAATASGLFSGRVYARAIYGATASSMEIDGSAGAPASITPNSGSARARIGATDAGAPSFFWQGQMRDVIVTSILTIDEAAKLQLFLLTRRAL